MSICITASMDWNAAVKKMGSVLTLPKQGR